VPVTAIDKSPWQPRREFGAGALEDLAASIREQGLIQPLVVRRVKGRYELIAGERRLRAAGLAGLETVPVLTIDVSDQEALELALVENLQREDLNVIEEAEGYRQLANRFNLTQEQIATRVGKGRATVANALRLLDLSEVIRTLLARGQLSAGHAKVLLQLESAKEREQLAHRVAREGISVRELERMVARQARPAPRRKSVDSRADLPRDHLHYLTEKLHHHFGTGVRVTPSSTLPNGKKTKGTIEIDFFSNDELGRLLEILGVDDAV
jgi:ParB family chromosome partitioning protein